VRQIHSLVLKKSSGNKINRTVRGLIEFGAFGDSGTKCTPFDDTNTRMGNRWVKPVLAGREKGK
jgi:hypothetical protein